MNFIVVGCGRVGAELSYRLFKSGHQIVVVDNNKETFNRLHPTSADAPSRARSCPKMYWNGPGFAKHRDWPPSQTRTL
jgi:6-phosphogluconate dehydrogenase (decarboxylating)